MDRNSLSRRQASRAEGRTMNENRLKAFAEPYYRHKDIMHNMWHIELVHKWMDRIILLGTYQPDYESLLYALYFHGFIYTEETAVRKWLDLEGIDAKKADFIIRISLESQRPEIPETLEGKILHDAHVLEGGKNYLVVKTLITGSVRGQDLPRTLDFMKNNVLDRNSCYLPETIPLCEEMNSYARQFLSELESGIF